jgi:hypothetical protein
LRLVTSQEQLPTRATACATSRLANCTADAAGDLTVVCIFLAAGPATALTVENPRMARTAIFVKVFMTHLHCKG